MSTLNRKEVRRRIHRRIRKKVSGTACCPRLAVSYSNQHIYTQVIDDTAGTTICAASSIDKGIEKAASNHCLLYTSPSPRDLSTSRMPSSA